MNYPLFFLAGGMLAPLPWAEAASYCIDFGPLSSSASYKYISTTRKRGWNNVAVAADQTQAGAVVFSSYYYGEDGMKTNESSSVENVSVYSKDGDEEAITMSGMKNGSAGTLTMLGGSGAAYAPDRLYEKFDPDVDLTVLPASSYQDFITMTNGDSFTLTFSGLKEGSYDILLAGGRTYAAGGKATAVSYTLNGESRILAGNDGSGGGQYAGLLEWHAIKIGPDGTLSLTVSGFYHEETGKWTSTALNGLMITQVPEPVAASFGLLGAAFMVFRRRRR